MKHKALSIILSLSFGFGIGQARGEYEKMDRETTTLVIEKIEKVVSNGPSEGTDGGAVYLRLADLYAERARLAFIEENEKNCDNCRGSKADRQKALKYYVQCVDRIDNEYRARVLIQMAYIQKTLGHSKEAQKLFETVINEGRKKHKPTMIAQAYASYGDFWFESGDYKKALPQYVNALKFKDFAQRGYVMYRMAWSEFNNGELKKAQILLVKVLTNQDLLDYDGDGKADSSFQMDASRDLVTFMSRTVIGEKEYNLIKAVSPKGKDIENLMYLAEESERFGARGSAILVWNRLFVEELTPQQRLEGHIRLVQIYLDAQKKSEAAGQVKFVAESWKKMGCSSEGGDEECRQKRLKLRKVIVDWHKFEKKKLTLALLEAYENYSTVVTDDEEMAFWGAGVARDLNENERSFKLFSRSTTASYDRMKSKAFAQLDKKAQKNIQTIFEGSLVGEVELAERLKDPQLKLAAYNHYLDMNPDGAKAGEITYQKARAYYELKNYREAYDLFYTVAVRYKSMPTSLRLQSADLSLDCLALLKDHEMIEKSAMALSQEFPERRTEYSKIASTAALNQTFTVISKEQKSDYENALKKLKAFPLASAPVEDQVKFLKNRVVLAERLKLLGEVNDAGERLLKISALTSEDREWTLSKLLWAAEMELNFKKAYSYAQMSKLPKSKEADRQLKLGLLAELAHLPAQQHFIAYMNESKNLTAANQVRADLIRKSQQPWTRIEKEWKELKKTPDILSDLVLDMYSKYGYSPVSEKISELGRHQKNASALLVGKTNFIRKFDEFQKKTSGAGLNRSSDQALQKSLKNRLDLITQSENWATQAISSQDWSLQLITLKHLQNENLDLYEDLKHIAPPRGLTPEQKQQYAGLLNQRASEFKNKAQTISDKLAQLWKNDRVLNALSEQYEAAPRDLQNLLKHEIEQLRDAAPRNYQIKLARLLKFKSDGVNNKDILVARQDLKDDPFNTSAAKKLRELESRGGNPFMVSFLDYRMDQMKGEKQ